MNPCNPSLTLRDIVGHWLAPPHDPVDDLKPAVFAPESSGEDLLAESAYRLTQVAPYARGRSFEEDNDFCANSAIALHDAATALLAAGEEPAARCAVALEDAMRKRRRFMPIVATQIPVLRYAAMTKARALAPFMLQQASLLND